MTSSSPTGRGRGTVGVAGLWVTAGSLVLGGLTSAAQGVLPDSLRSFANSPSGWTSLTVVLVSLARLRLVPAAVLGAVSFVCLVLGYTFVSELRGLSYSPVFWSAVGLVAGPVVGWAASAAFGPTLMLSAVGSSLIAGVLLTDAVYGLTIIKDTTSPTYWWAVGTAGVLFLGSVAVRRGPSRRYVAVQLGLTLVWLTLGYAGYAVLNGIHGA